MEQKGEIHRNKINRKIIINGCIFIILLGIVLLIVFKNRDIDDIWFHLKRTNIFYVGLALGAALVYLILEGINYSQILKSLNNKVSILRGFKYACIGFFFSSITPSATGGGPFQVYYMTKDDIDISHASIAVFLELAGFHLSTVLITFIGILVNFSFIKTLSTGFHLLLAVGIFIQLLLVLMFLFCIFSKKLAKKMINLVISIVRFFKLSKADDIKERLLDSLDKYNAGASYVKHHKKKFIFSVIRVFFQVVSLYTVPYLIYLAFGLDRSTIFTFITLQGILYSATAIVPVPGAMGAAESGFLSIYCMLYPKGMLTPAMLLTRFTSFYFVTFMSGIIVIYNQFKVSNKE